MLTLAQMKTFVREASHLLAREHDLAAFEVYCASAEHRVARLNYTSDIPCRGVEEFKAINADGFALRIVTRRDAQETGYASSAGDLGLDSVRDTLARARRALIVDPHFPGLPPIPANSAVAGAKTAGGDLTRATDSALAAAAWKIIAGAIQEFSRRAAADLLHPGLIVGGDMSIVRDRVAIGGSNFAQIRTDEGAHFISSVTALIEALTAKGTATAVGAMRTEMTAAADRLGRDAVARAFALRNGERPAAGNYRVIFGPQPVAELLNYMVIPSLTTGAFQAASSAYHGRFGLEVMDPRFSIADDPAAKSGPVHRRITCEGLPAARTQLIRDGKVVGLLSNYYDAHRLLTDEHREEKLGTAANGAQLAFPAHNAYRLGESPARRFDAHPGASGTNVMMKTKGGVDEKQLIAEVGDGIYIGRVWYTYPINGQRAGDFTCTVSGDSYVIRNGKLAAPLAPNALRVNANIAQVFAQPIGVGKRALPAVVWGAPEAYFAPSIAVEGISLAAVAGVEAD
jgi:predicted Zn-dependent protease